MVGGPEGFGFWFVVITAVVFGFGVVVVVAFIRILNFAHVRWLERGAETVRVHRVDAAGAREVDAVGGKIGRCAAEELSATAVGVGLFRRGGR